MPQPTIVVDARLPWGSGIGRYVQNVVPGVARAMPDVRFTVMLPETEMERAHRLFSGIENAELRASSLTPFSLAEQLSGRAIWQGYDLAWFTNYWVPLGFNAPFVAIVYDLLHLEPELFPAGRVKRALSWATFRHIGRRARQLFFISHFSQAEFERRFRRRTAHTMSSLGIDHVGAPSPFADDHPSGVAKSPRILVVAAAKAHKNFELAVEAFGRARIPDHWKLTIITPPDALRSSIDLDAIAAADPRVELLRGISDEALLELYRDTAIVMMPSRYEGFGLPLAEGLAGGATCLSSTAPALVELGSGAPVVFLDPNDRQAWSEALERECARFDSGAVDESERAASIRHARKYVWAPVIDVTVDRLRAALNHTSERNRH